MSTHANANIDSQIGSGNSESMRDVQMPDANLAVLNLDDVIDDNGDEHNDKNAKGSETASGHKQEIDYELHADMSQDEQPNRRLPNMADYRRDSPPLLPPKRTHSQSSTIQSPSNTIRYSTNIVVPSSMYSGSRGFDKSMEERFHKELMMHKQKLEQEFSEQFLQKDKDVKNQNTRVAQVRREEKERAKSRLAAYDLQLERQSRDHSNEISRLRQEAAKEIQNRHEFNMVLQSELEEKKRMLRESDMEISKLEGQVKTMQEGAFRSVEAAQWAPEAVSDIDRKLKSILSGIKQWSEKHAKLPIEHVLAQSQFESLKTLLLGRRCISSPWKLHEKLGKNATMQKPGRAASLLLAAAAAADVLELIVGDPLFAFVGTGRTLLERSDRSALRALLELIGSSDEAGAHALRCQLLRLLDPPTSNPNKGARLAKEIAAKSRQEAAHIVAEKVTQDFAGLLMPKSEVREALAGLESVALTAAELSWSLWTRKTKVEVLTLAELAPSKTQEHSLPFQHSMEILEPHPLNRVHLEDDPSALDGHEVLVLYSPAVQAAGTAEGQDYHKTKLWRKAVVWLG